ncbi:MAG: right-handed parallel beta-helix repeat-containing protein [Oscillospiraceae bacterium]|nr:right-handed parallel beta-helix repeat-containing protein [Oscillospiraceae bacterium]
MYSIKTIDCHSNDMILYQCTWLITETVRFNELQICERAILKAPEGKILTLIVNGVGKGIKPGIYKGEVILAVTDPYVMQPHGLMRANQLAREFHCAAVVEDGQVCKEKCLSEIIQRGSLDGNSLRHARIASSEECFNGVVVAGSSNFTVKDVKIDFEGFGDNDYLGVGTAVTAIDKSCVLIDGCAFHMSGVTRCVIHAGGDSQVTVRNSKLMNVSPDTDWLGSFTWQLAISGSNRLVQLTDNANVTYENCDMFSNGWGICSIDGTEESCRLIVKNSRLTLSGPRAHGYGVFCIGENEAVIDGCQMDIEGYPLMLMGMEGLGKATIKDSNLRSGHFGVFVVSDDNSVLNIKDSCLNTVDSSLCIKGSSTVINIDNTELCAGNGTIVQLMDTEESGMDAGGYVVPVGIEDKPIPGRDLATVSTSEDVTLNISNCVLSGNIYNSTTNIRAYKNSVKTGMGKFHDTVVGILKFPPALPDSASLETPDGMLPMGADSIPPVPPEGMDLSMLDPVRKRHHGDDLKGPKNIGIILKNSKITGVISAAKQTYREGITFIDESNRQELSNITQSAAPTVNNGVSVTLLLLSEWIVTGTSYITALAIQAGATVKAEEGKTLIMTVDGVETAIVPGSYKGKIVISVT